MSSNKNILPDNVADKFTVDPKAPVRFVHRIYGEHDLRKVTLKEAQFLSDRGIYLKPVAKKPSEKS